MKIGDMVVPAFENLGDLKDSNVTFRHAMVLSVEPFKLATQAGTRIWTDKDPQHYIATGRLTPEQFNAITRALPPEEQVRMPVGESFMTNRLGNGLTLIEVSIEPKAVDLTPQRMEFEVKESETDSRGWFTQNPTYEWLFVYKPATNCWHAQRKLEGDELKRAHWVHEQNLVACKFGDDARMIQAIPANR